MSSFILNIKLVFLYASTHKLRTFLTALGLIIGISSLILVISLGGSAQKSIIAQMQKLGTNIIVVLPGGSDKGKPSTQIFSSQEITTLKYADAQALKKAPGVVAMSAYVRGSAQVSHMDKVESVLFSGVDSDYTSVENASLLEGRFFTSQENKSMARVAVLGKKIADDLFGKSNPLERRVKINGRDFKVIGVMKKRGKVIFFDYDKQVFLPVKTAQKILLGVNHINFIRAKVAKEKDIPSTVLYFKRILRHRHYIKDPKKDDFTIRDTRQMLDIFYKVTDALKNFLALIAGVSLIVGGIGMSNVMYVIVDERIREIGLRKAVGARNSDILYQFLLESTLLSLFGGTLGILLGILTEFLISFGAGKVNIIWPFSLSLLAILLSLIISFFIGLAFGFLPAKKASRLSPAEAMRYE